MAFRLVCTTCTLPLVPDRLMPSSQVGSWMLTQLIQPQASQPSHTDPAKPSSVGSVSFEDSTTSSDEIQEVSCVGGKVGKKPRKFRRGRGKKLDDKMKSAMTCFAPLRPC